MSQKGLVIILISLESPRVVRIELYLCLKLFISSADLYPRVIIESVLDGSITILN